jgi:hypothetical protein
MSANLYVTDDWRTGGKRSKRSMAAAVGNPPEVKLIDRNTIEYVDQWGSRRIRLHNTDILVFPKAGGFTIDTGGFNTVTTRDRLNKFLPAGWLVFTDKGTIYLSNIHRDDDSWSGTLPTGFVRTVEVDAKGHAHSDSVEGDREAEKRKIDAYMKAWAKRGLPTADESKGDPWIALLQDSSNRHKVDREIMLDWVDSQYVFRGLYGLALAYAGMSETGIGWSLDSVDSKGGKLSKYELSRIRRYVRACLGGAA